MVVDLERKSIFTETKHFSSQMILTPIVSNRYDYETGKTKLLFNYSILVYNFF